MGIWRFLWRTESYPRWGPLQIGNEGDDGLSGGHFDYENSRLYDWSVQVRTDGNPLLADLLHDIGDLLHEYDWWKSGDTSREKWLEAWKGWQEKWMKGSVKEMVIDSLKDEIRLMVWESLGKPEDREYERIEEKFRGW